MQIIWLLTSSWRFLFQLFWIVVILMCCSLGFQLSVFSCVFVQFCSVPSSIHFFLIFLNKLFNRMPRSQLVYSIVKCFFLALQSCRTATEIINGNHKGNGFYPPVMVELWLLCEWFASEFNYPHYSVINSLKDSKFVIRAQNTTIRLQSLSQLLYWYCIRVFPIFFSDHVRKLFM